jgi:hypothetical protein
VYLVEGLGPTLIIRFLPSSSTILFEFMLLVTFIMDIWRGASHHPAILFLGVK